MLYVQEKEFAKQIDIIEHLSFSSDFDFIIWFYPESSNHDVCGLPIVVEKEGEPVTTYFDGTAPVKTKRLPLDLDSIKKMRTDSNLIQENCDSIVLYEKDKFEWSVCAIYHEGVCFVRNESLKEYLESRGFSLSSEPPDWM